MLIDACNKIREKKVDKVEIIQKLSNSLRKRAELNGIDIDEIFRNENGISLQMIKMEYLLTDGKTGLSGARKLYVKIEKLSKSYPTTEFERNLCLQKGKLEKRRLSTI